MSLWVRVNNNFYTHRKTMRLRAALGNDALWIVPRIWAYAAEHNPDGTLGDLSAGELALAIGYTGDAQALLQALLGASFLDPDPLRIHDWAEHNGYHKSFAERARKAANAKWEKVRAERGAEQKESSKEKGEENTEITREEKRGEEASIASGIACASGAERQPPTGSADMFASTRVKLLPPLIRRREELLDRESINASSYRDAEGKLLPECKTELDLLEKKINEHETVLHGQPVTTRTNRKPKRTNGRSAGIPDTPKPDLESLMKRKAPILNVKSL